MFKKSLNLLIITVFIGMLLLITSCSTGIKSVLEMYYDDKTIENDQFEIEYVNEYCSKDSSGNYEFMASILIKNNEISSKSFSIKNASIIKESTDVKYSVKCSKYSITLEAEMNEKVSVRSKIPSSINDDKYILVFTINSCEITIHLYARPVDLKEDRKISYYIDSKLVGFQTVKDGMKIGKVLVYEGEDNITYCDTWYENNTTMRNSESLVTSDMKLYGKLISNFKWSNLTTIDGYAMIDKVVHVPSNKILIIPDTIQNLSKPIAISNYAIRDITVNKIYIPITVKMIYAWNFENISGAEIHYEGSEEQWRKLFYSSSSIVTTNVVYNSTY